MAISGDDFVAAIKAAAQSELGIIALIVLCMSVVGVLLFRGSPDAIKFRVFMILIVGLCSFSFLTMQELQSGEPLNESAKLIASDDPSQMPEFPSKSAPNSGPIPIVPKSNGQLETAIVRPEVELEETGGVVVPSKAVQKGYIYLGTFKNKKWTDPRFVGASGSLEVKDVITLSVDRTMFNCAPFRKSIFSIKFTYCNDVIGEVFKGGKVRIHKEPELIGMSRIWVYVESAE